MVLIYSSLIWWLMMLSIFAHGYGLFVCLLLWSICSSLLPIFNWVIYFLFWIVKYLYILDKSSLVWCMHWEYILQICCLSLHFSVLQKAEILILVKTNLWVIRPYWFFSYIFFWNFYTYDPISKASKVEKIFLSTAGVLDLLFNYAAC